MNSRAALVIAMLCFAFRVDAQTSLSYLLDPFAQATSGDERCCLAGTCECGGPYKHDAEINDRVVEAIRIDKRFRDTAVWVTTTRGFVTLRGCVRNPAQKNALGRVVKRQAGVVLVWNEVAIGRTGK